MATFADFIPNMRLEIADLFDEKVEQYLRETMIDFATKTGCLTANAEVALDAGKWGAVIEVETMLTETPFKTLWVKDNLTYLKESGFDGGKSGMPSLYKDLGATLIFDRAPVSPLVFTAFCMVKPKYDATNFNNRFLTDYKEAIEQGALFRVCMTPGGRWFNPEMAQFHKVNYDNLLRQAKASVITAHNAYVQPVRFV
jgi:hypothetical protein